MPKKTNKSKKVVFYNEEYLANKLGIDRRTFHREIKPIILSDFPEILKELGVDNPDIGLDKQNIIYLADPNHTNIISTDWSIFSYLTDNNEDIR
jgi:hypothetical protein